MSEYGITSKGFKRKRLDKIIDEISTYLKNNMNVDPRETPQSLLSTLVVSFADQLETLWELHEKTYDSQYPSMAEGVNLDNALQFAGITRSPKARSGYTLSCTGVDGTVIPYSSLVKSTTQPVRQLRAAATQEISRENFCKIKLHPVLTDVASSTKFSYTLTVPVEGGASQETFSNELSGFSGFEAIYAALLADFKAKATGAEITVSEEVTETVDENGDYIRVIVLECNNPSAAYSIELSNTIIVSEVTSNLSYETMEYGDINLPAGTITEIVSAIDGFRSVNNIGGYIPGRLAETDEEIRASYIKRVAVRGINTLDAICAQLLEDVAGCTYAVGYENDTDEVDKDGRPPHSLEIVVQGGDDTEVASIIFHNKPAGIRAFGSEYSYAIDNFGNRQSVQFSRINRCYLLLSVTVEADSTLDNNYSEAITALLSEMQFDAGTNIKLQNLIPAILREVTGVTYVDIRGQLSAEQELSSADPEKWVHGTVLVGLRQEPIIRTEGIEVKLSNG